MAGCGHEHHEHEKSCSAERGLLYNLYTKIDTSKLQCLNEATEGSAANVFKPWEERKDETKFVESDVDQELLFNIPFTGSIKLKGVIVIGGADGQHPSQMKLYKNRPYMSFDDTNAEADQTFDLQHDYDGQLEYTPKIARFCSVNCLSIYFPENFGDETTKILYIGLKGEFQEAHRHEVTICTYEARANPSDHKSNAFDHVSHGVS